MRIIQAWRPAPPANLIAAVGILVLASSAAFLTGALPAELSHAWPASGLLLGGFLALPRRDQWKLALVGLAAECAVPLLWAGTAGHALRAVGQGGLTVATAWAGAVLAQRVLGRALTLDRLGDVLVLGMVALVAPALGASAGFLLDGAGLSLLPRALWLSWGVTQGLSDLLFAPVVLAAVAVSTGPRQWRWPRIAEAGALILVLVATLLVLFTQPGSSRLPETWLAPTILWAAFRFGPGGAAVAILIMAATALPAGLLGLGPIVSVEDPAATRLGATELVLALTALSALGTAAVVGERRRTEQRARANQSRLQRIFDSDLIGIVSLGSDGRILEANRYVQHLLNIDDADLAGGTLTPLSFTPEGYEAEARAGWAELVDTGNSPARPARYRRRDGARVDVLLTAGRLEGEGPPYVALMVDITDRQRQEQLMAETEAVAHIGGWAYNQLTGDLVWTRETHRIHGTDPDTYRPTVAEAIAFYTEDSQPVIAAAVERALAAGTPYDLELQLRTRGGRVLDVRATGRAERDGERVTRIFGTFQDITERRRLEAQLLQAQKMEGLGRLAGGIAHDFNNILTAVFGYLSLLEEGDEVVDRAESLAGLRTASERAAALVRQLLTFARQQMASPVLVDPGTLVGRLGQLLARVIGEDVRLVLDLPPALHPVLVDPTQFEQVLVNLAVNARDAMPRGGTLTIRLRDVPAGAAELAAFSESPTAPGLLLTVSDTGVGIAPEVLPMIFDPFFTTKPVGKGTGLGLATCYGIVRQAGGQIAVESTVGHGTTFRVWLPHGAGAAAPLQPARAAAPPGDTARPGETVLVVEDDPAVRSVTSRILVDAGYRVVVVPSGPEALRLEASLLASVTLLLTDVVMPDMSGVTLAAELQGRYPGLRTLFVSGYSADVATHHGVTDPALTLVVKPFTTGQLRRRVREVLDTPPR